MTEFRAVVFDLDDTLYPERDYVLSGFKAVSEWAERAIGIPKEQGFRQLSDLFEIGIRGNTFDVWLRTMTTPVSPTIIENLVRVYRNHQPDLIPFPETVDVLKQLKTRVSIGLLTDGHASVQRLKVASLGISNYFNAIVISDELGGKEAWKPSTLPFEHVLGRMRVAPDKAAYVGDNPAKDFIGARRANMFSVRVRRPGGEHFLEEPSDSEYAPNREISNLNELAEALCLPGR